MMNPTDEVKSATDLDLKNFGLILGTGLAIIFGLFWPWVSDKAFYEGYPLWPWICLGVFGGLGLTVPRILNPLYRVWMRVGLVLGYINTRIIMGLMFYTLFMPIGLMIRLFGGDLLSKKLDSKIDSYRVSSTPTKPENLEKPY